jgi:phenylacetate-CoA ligase
MFEDKIGALQELNQRLQGALDRVLGIRVRVTLVEAHSIERSEGKAKRVIDRRTS